MDGTSVLYSKWSSGQPDSEREQCTVIEQADGFAWHDVFCDRQEAFICKSGGILAFIIEVK